MRWQGKLTLVITVNVFFFSLPVNGWSNPVLFQNETIGTPWAIIPQNLKKVLHFWGLREQTNKQTH